MTTDTGTAGASGNVGDQDPTANRASLDDCLNDPNFYANPYPKIMRGSKDMNSGKTLNDWLAYSIDLRQLKAVLRPAMWGNGQLELFAELKRPCVSEVVCFGFGDEGLWYASQRDPTGAEEHLVPAVYDADTGKKYLLHSAASSWASKAAITFRPDRQIWCYEFDDLTVDVSLILPRMHPGYLFKLDMTPRPGNPSRRWLICHEVRGFHGNSMRATEADYQLMGSAAWFRSPVRGHGEAIGATADAQSINPGWDGQYAADIMTKVLVEREGADEPTRVYLARAFGGTIQEARDGLAKLLDSPERLESETEDWWNQYLNEVPRLDTPDESFCKTFLWSWPNVRMNRIDLPRGKVPAGLWYSNNVSLKFKPSLAIGLGEDAVQLLHDSNPSHDLLLFVLRVTRKHGIFSCGWWGGAEFPGGYYEGLAYACGLAYKYVLTTGDFTLLREDIGGMTFLQRLEDALEVQLAYKDDKTGLFRTDDESARSPGGEGGLGPNMEAIVRYRGASGIFYNDSSAVMFGTLLVLSDIEALAGNHEKSSRFGQLAEELRQAIQRHLWNEKIGFFCDKREDGSFTDYLGIGGFWTGLFANQVYRPGGVATKEQAEKLAAWCNHPDFASEFGVTSLARSSPYFDPEDYKGFSGGFDMIWCHQIPAGLYAHECYEEAHRQLFKLFRRLGENAGLGPRYRGESYTTDTGEILPWRFVNYPSIFGALSSVIEGVFGLRWTNDALTAQVNPPWPWAKLSNLRIRKSLLDLELTADGSLVATINGKEVARSTDRKVKLPWEMFT